MMMMMRIYAMVMMNNNNNHDEREGERECTAKEDVSKLFLISNSITTRG